MTIRTNLAEWFSSFIFSSSTSNSNNDPTSNPSIPSSNDSSHASVELEISRREPNSTISRPSIATRSVCLGDSSDPSIRVRPSGDDESSSRDEEAVVERKSNNSNRNILELDGSDNPSAVRNDAIARVGLCIFLPMVVFISILFLAIRGGYLFGTTTSDSSLVAEEAFP